MISTPEVLSAECSRIQSSNWTLKGTGCPKASGRLSPTNNTNNNDDPIFMKEALLSTHRQLPLKSPLFTAMLHSYSGILFCPIRDGALHHLFESTPYFGSKVCQHLPDLLCLVDAKQLRPCLLPKVGFSFSFVVLLFEDLTDGFTNSF